jgi:hypothetical protein
MSFKNLRRERLDHDRNLNGGLPIAKSLKTRRHKHGIANRAQSN